MNPCKQGDNGKPCLRVRRGANGCLLNYNKAEDCALCFTYLHRPHLLLGKEEGGVHTQLCSDTKPTASLKKLTLQVRPNCMYKGAWVCDCGNGGNPHRSRYRCDHPNEKYDQCTDIKVGDEFQACEECPEYTSGFPQPLGITRIDSNKLAPANHDAQFNGGILRYNGKLLLAYRVGYAGSQVWVSELDENYVPQNNTCLLGLFHPTAAHWGREDPRLFVYQGRLHVSYHGVVGRTGPTNVLYARLTDDYAVEEVFFPQIAERQSWEKSHVYFEGDDGNLYMVYSISPHKVYRVEGVGTTLVANTTHKFKWSGGELRGGASPVRVGNRFYCWFHGRIGAWGDGVYTMGCYVFEAHPPFRILGMTPNPVMVGNPKNYQAWQEKGFPAAIWPAGAVLEDGMWKVGYGLQDQWCEVASFSPEEVDQAMGLSTVSEHDDVALAPALFDGVDPVHTGYKIDSTFRKAHELSVIERRQYVAPFELSCTITGMDFCILHRGLDAPECQQFQQCAEVTKLTNFERRFYSALEYVRDHPEKDYVVISDVNDVLFTENMFTWMRANAKYGDETLFVGEEFQGWDHNWFDDGLNALPPTYTDLLRIQKAGQQTITCGIFGGKRPVILSILEDMIRQFDEIETDRQSRGFVSNAIIDMAVFARAVFESPYRDKLVRFKMDAETPTDGVSSPLMHNRVEAMRMLAERGIVV